MNSSTYRRPGAFSPRPPTSPAQSQGQRQSTDSSASDSSSSSQITSQSVAKQSPQSPVSRRHIFGAPSSNTSSTSLHNFSRPSITHASSELPLRRTSPLISGSESQKHKRQHSQGFFEPSLPTATIADHSAMANLTASQIAAQAAMQHQSSSQHIRKRSLTVPGPQSPPEPASGRLKPAPLQTGTGAAMKPSNSSVSGQQYHNGLVGGHTVAATSAANAAFPRVAQVSPGLTSFDQAPEKEHKLKTERSKMKLFSKPKHIGISSYKDLDRKDKPLPSPNKMGPPGPSGLSKMINPSVTSLVDSTASNTPSLYASNNGSTSTLVPLDRQTTFEKEKAHRHHFLSRQKNKLKDRIDDHTLPLSSASSNSKPLDPSAPQSLYSFAPSSPGPSTTSFTKSMSGLDLRHGGRALREKKKEEKAYAAGPPFESKRSEIDRNDWAVPTSFPSSHAFLGSSIANSASIFGGPPSSHGGDPSQLGLQGFGLSNMSPEDAWDFLKAKLLIIFEGEELRMPIEDLNRLVSVHIQCCIHKRSPIIITEDLRKLLQTGFLSLNHTLRGTPDHRLIPRLVEMWLFVFGTILPYMQAVFHPLDLEFKGRGTIMTTREALDFWGAAPSPDNALAADLDIRRFVLVSFRDNVILTHHDSLKATFSRLSLESINAALDDNQAPVIRPSTAASLDPGTASFNSQGSTLLGDASVGARSRATSNTSAPELPSFGSPGTPRRGQQPLIPVSGPPDSAQVTETVGRMLQCVSVLASMRSGDDAQAKMEGLAKELKLNWLGRGRTGRNRRGFVGTRVRREEVSVL